MLIRHSTEKKQGVTLLLARKPLKSFTLLSIVKGEVDIN